MRRLTTPRAISAGHADASAGTPHACAKAAPSIGLASGKSKTVLILAHPHDIHARAIAAEVGATFGGRPIILNTADYPRKWQLTAAIGNRTTSYWRLHSGHLTVRSHQVSGVWRRRTEPHRIHAAVEDRWARLFSLNEASAAFQGWLHSMGRLVVNPLGAEYVANRKLFQLLKAKEVGLDIPDTIVTSDAEEARQFLDRMNGTAIFKVLAGERRRLIETRRFRKSYFRKLAALRYAPLIFQELVEAEQDIRVTIVDEEVFSASIRPTTSKAQLDWRLDLTAKIEPHVLPARIESKLVDLLRSLGLRFGVLDVRLTPDGKYVFLEVNSSGQFLFCEIQGKLAISRAVAAALLRSTPPNSSRTTGRLV